MSIKELEIKEKTYKLINKNLTTAKPITKKKDMLLDINELDIKEKYKPYVQYFFDKTKEDFYFRKPDKILKTLKIEKLKKKKANKLNIFASYNLKKNKIRIYKESSIYHELFHAVTSHQTLSRDFIGFNQYNNFYDVANSLDEGYTDLLTNRYFNNEITYMIEANIAYKLEKIIEQDKMQRMYTENNLLGIVNFLAKFSSKKEAIAFLNLIDKLDDISYESKQAITIMNILSNYLVNIYLKLLVENYSKGIINRISVEEVLFKYKEEFTKYAFYNDDFEKEYLRSTDYLDITSKLSSTHFQKCLSKKLVI